MISIIPNWHPIFVHFTIGLLSVSVLFYLLRTLLPIRHQWQQQWLAMANWSLWSGCVFAVVTVITGWFAYNSVAHDEVSHAAMTLHRNWAIPTVILFLLLGLSAINFSRKNNTPNRPFISISSIAVLMLMMTGWLGAEGVYRYGLGVISLPAIDVEQEGHHHFHDGETIEIEETSLVPNTNHDSDGHDH